MSSRDWLHLTATELFGDHEYVIGMLCKVLTVSYRDNLSYASHASDRLGESLD